jgi:hypothetical protein
MIKEYIKILDNYHICLLCNLLYNKSYLNLDYDIHHNNKLLPIDIIIKFDYNYYILVFFVFTFFLFFNSFNSFNMIS